jgi:hypothetical protein
VGEAVIVTPSQHPGRWVRWGQADALPSPLSCSWLRAQLGSSVPAHAQSPRPPFKMGSRDTGLPWARGEW